MKQKVMTFGLITGIAGLVLASPVSALTTRIVDPNTLQNGWSDQFTKDGGQVLLAEGAPEGFGNYSLELSTDSTNDSKANYSRPESIALNDITTLSYWTYQKEASLANGTASLQLGVDLNNDGSWDTNLVYEPGEQGMSIVPNQWMNWDAAEGVFWSSNADSALAKYNDIGGYNMYSLSDVYKQYPEAQIVGLAVNVGTYNPDYRILVDGVQLNGKVYNFEKALSATSKNACKSDGWRNTVSASGKEFKNQGQCVASVEANANANFKRDQ